MTTSEPVVPDDAMTDGIELVSMTFTHDALAAHDEQVRATERERIATAIENDPRYRPSRADIAALARTGADQ